MSEPLTFAVALRALEIHLTFATLVSLAAWAVTLPPRVSATTKYWIWVATSINFILPIGVLVDRFRPPEASWFLPLEDFGNEVTRQRTVGLALGAAWVLGLLVMLGRLSLRVRGQRQPRRLTRGAAQRPAGGGALAEFPSDSTRTPTLRRWRASCARGSRFRPESGGY